MALPRERYLREVLLALADRRGVVAAAIWLRNPQGFLQLQCQSNIENVGLDKYKNGRQSHNELLRQAFQTAKSILLEPFGSTGILEGITAGNPTEFANLLAPLLRDRSTPVGLLEIWQTPDEDGGRKRIQLQMLVNTAGVVSNWLREHGNES
jgi:hypothetical protein